MYGSLEFDKSSFNFYKLKHNFGKFIFTLISILNGLFPLLIAYMAFRENVFKMSIHEIACFCLVFLHLSICLLSSAKLWWQRRDLIVYYSNTGNPFFATLVLATIIRTLGDWIFIMYGIFGSVACFVGSFYLSEYDFQEIFKFFGLFFVKGKALALVILPTFSFFVLILCNAIAECMHMIVMSFDNQGFIYKTRH